MVEGWKLVALLLVTVGAFGTISWWGCNQGSSSENSASAQLEIVSEVWDNLASDHVDSAELDLSLLGQAAIEGMLGVLNDPFTTYVTPENYSQRQSSITGEFEGIGAEVQLDRDERLMIVAVLPGTPAETVGLKPGDVVLEVDGESIAGLSPFESVIKIRGPKGSSVELLVKHPQVDEPELVAIVRDTISVTSVRMQIIKDDLAYIRISAFQEDTNEELESLLQEASEAGVLGIIMDLRNNPGGLLEETVDVTSQFLEEGLVLYEIDGSGERKDREVHSGGLAPDLPLVVMVNQFSASGSEVMAGALRDHDRALLVGTTTFGKGSVNVFRRLSNGGGLFLTIARWYTPSGVLIEGNGLEPDFEVAGPVDFRLGDPQLAKALELLRAEVAAGTG